MCKFLFLGGECERENYCFVVDLIYCLENHKLCYVVFYGNNFPPLMFMLLMLGKFSFLENIQRFSILQNLSY